MKLNLLSCDAQRPDRKAILATTVLQEKVVPRMCLINPRTTMEDILDTLKLCQVFTEEVRRFL